MLRTGEVLQVYELSLSEASELKSRCVKCIHHKHELYESPEKQIMLTEYGESFVYPSMEVFKKSLEGGFSSNSVFFSYCPSFQLFIASKEKLIHDLFVELQLDLAILKQSENPISRLERALHDKKFTEKQQLQKLFLGILAFCGDILCAELDAEWDCTDVDTAVWEPVLKTQDGKLLRAFVDLDENLFGCFEGTFLPMLGMRTDLIVEENVNRVYYWYHLDSNDNEGEEPS